MLKPFTPEQQIEAALRRRNAEQEELAKEGISSAVMGDQVVTIGDPDCNYNSFKHFIVAQIARLDIWGFADKYGWDLDELVEDLADEESDSSLWRQETMDHFNGVEGDD